MPQPSELFPTAVSSLLWFIGILLIKYRPLTQWPRFLIWLAGWSAVYFLSKAFDASGHFSIRSEAISWGGIAIFVIMFIQSWRKRNGHNKPASGNPSSAK